jgi:hypothetical protein
MGVCERLREMNFRNLGLHKHFGREKFVSPWFQGETNFGFTANPSPSWPFGHMKALGRSKSNPDKHLHQRPIPATGFVLARVACGCLDSLRVSNRMTIRNPGRQE